MPKAVKIVGKKKVGAKKTTVDSNRKLLSQLRSQLKTTQHKYRELVEDAVDGIYELDENGKFAFVNPAAAEITGYSKKELLQKHFWELFSPDDRQKLTQEYIAMMKSKAETAYKESPILSKEGRELWIGQNIRLYYRKDRLTTVRVVARDITSIKETQQKLVNEHILLRTIVDIIPVNIYVKDKNLKRVLTNRMECEYLGVNSEEETIGKTDFDFYPEATAEISRAEDLKVLQGEPILAKETLNIKRDGKQTWFLVSKVPLRNCENKIIGISGISIDISDRKKSESRLAQSEELFRLLSENSTDIICLHEANDWATYKYVSPSIKTILGYSPEELIGTSPFALQHPEDAANIKAGANSKTIRGAAVENVEFRIKHKDGRYVWMEAWTKPFFDKDGKVVSFETSTRDISLRKKIEEQLLKAKEEAESAAKTKSEFLSVMSHEIRTPLNGVIGLTQLLMNGSPRADQMEKLRLLQFSANTLLSLLNDILDFNKIEAGKLTFETISFNLSELLSHTVKMFDPNAREKKLGLILKIDERFEPLVKGDPVRISQVLTNLISNAIKFTDKGIIEISASQNEKGIYFFSVKDTGIGIAIDRLNAIFESFTQAEARTTRKYGGSGLGLTISKQLVEMMGGKMSVESKLGEGSLFSFELALPGADKLPEPEARQAELHFSNVNKKYRVLLAEDDMVSQAVTKQFLSDWGFDVTAVATGSDALDMIKTLKFDLVLMDIHMPGKLGNEVATEVRQADGDYFKNIPIIIMTASTVGDVRAELLKSGVTDFIGKPFEADHLHRVLNYHLRENSKHEMLTPLLADNLFKSGDAQFKSTLIELIIGNITELKLTLNSGDSTLYHASLHKSKTALKYLNHLELNELLEEVRNGDEEVIPPKKT